MYEEGDIADGPNGQTLIYRGGQWLPMGGNAPSPITLGTPNPVAQQKAAVDLAAATAAAQRAAQSAPVDLAIKQAQLSQATNPRAAPPSGYRYKSNGDLEPIPGGPIVGQNGVKKGNGALDAIVGQINDVNRQFETGIGTTSGFSGLMDFLPFGENRAFDAAASGLEDQAAMAFRVPGSGTVSDADAARIAAANKPNRWDNDAANRQRLKQLRLRVDAAREAAGLPPAQWDTSSAIDGGGGGMGARSVATGATRTERDPAASAIIDRLVRNGGTVDQANTALQALGLAPVDAAQFGAAQAYHRKNPKYKGSYGDITREVDQSTMQRASASPAAAFTTSAIDAGTGGLFSNLTGSQDQLAAMQSVNPNAGLAGTIIGGVAGSAGLEGGLGRLGARVAGRSALASRALSSPFTADAIFGGVSGATAGGDAANTLGGVASGVGGGMFGRGLTRGIGRGVRGVRDESARYLAERNVPLTVGQAVGNAGLLGHTIKSVEDRLTGIPLIGDQINARRLEGFQGFNQAAFDEGLAPIQATTNGITGEAGIDAARNLRSQAYRAALDPVTVQADGPFMADYAAARIAGRRLPQDMAGRADFTLDRALENVNANGTVNGRGVQQAMRRFRREASRNEPLPNGYDFGEVMSQGENAFVGMVNRQSPETIPSLERANAANRNVEVLRDAVTRSRNGTRVGEAGLFAPSQLADAATANARRFGNGNGTTNQPFFNLSRAGQNVLPSRVADSGTAGRLATLALPAALTGGGAAAGYAGGDASTGTELGLGLGALLTAGGTRAGQRALVAAATRRPDSFVRIGDGIYRLAPYGGMFGAGIGATVPSLLSQ